METLNILYYFESGLAVPLGLFDKKNTILAPATSLYIVICIMSDPIIYNYFRFRNVFPFHLLALCQSYSITDNKFTIIVTIAVICVLYGLRFTRVCWMFVLKYFGLYE